MTNALLWQKALPMVIPIAMSYLCETGFSAIMRNRIFLPYMAMVKTKYR